MYKIENRQSGYILTFAGTIEPNEIKEWIAKSKSSLALEKRESFGVIIDMRDLQPLSAESRQLMVEGQKLYKDKGMKRSAVILNNQEITTQFKNVAVQSGIYITERYINANGVANATELAIKWVKDAIDPDK